MRVREDKKILTLDFDGVIHDGTYDGSETPTGPPVDGALLFMARATILFDVNVFSARSITHLGRTAMKEYLIRHAMKDPSPEVCARNWIREVKFPEHKPPAFLAYDDRTLTFRGKFDDPKKLLEFRTWREDRV
jgi:hypothetical protein